MSESYVFPYPYAQERAEADEIMEDKLVERLIAAQNRPEAWGVRKGAHLGKLSKRALGAVFSGIHNLVIPQHMLAVLNPGEILAKFAGAGALKQSKAPWSEDDFYQSIRKLDSVGYKHVGALTRSALKKKNMHSGTQHDRLNGLALSVQQSFMDSLRAEYVAPNNPRFADGASKALYTEVIHNFLKSSTR